MRRGGGHWSSREKVADRSEPPGGCQPSRFRSVRAQGLLGRPARPWYSVAWCEGLCNDDGLTNIQEWLRQAPFYRDDRMRRMMPASSALRIVTVLLASTLFLPLAASFTLRQDSTAGQVALEPNRNHALLDPSSIHPGIRPPELTWRHGTLQWRGTVWPA